MFHFQDTAEEKNPSEIHPTAYQEIKPNENLSIGDTIAFWDNIFMADSEVQNPDTLDIESLWSEIIDRYEDEFDFDIELDKEILSLLDRFEPENWENLSIKERAASIQDLTSAIGEKLELDEIPEIQFFEGPDHFCGEFNSNENVMAINVNTLFDPVELVDTVAHESRHAYQHQRAEHPVTMQDQLYRFKDGFKIK